MLSAHASDELKALLRKRDEEFWPQLARRSATATTFGQLAALSTLRKKAMKLGISDPRCEQACPLRIGLVGGSTLYPLSELIEHLVAVAIGKVELWSGEFNNYRSEILDGSSTLYEFKPDFLIILPDEHSCTYLGQLNDPKEVVEAEVERTAAALLRLCSVARETAGAEILLCNFILPATNDLGPVQAKSLASEWSFKKSINLALGVSAPNYVHICDLEFLAYRLGGPHAKDDRSWFESKQLCSPELQVALAQEIAHIIISLRTTPKKVLALDLDNTLWGGVIGDDGIEGIELGDTSPRGEAFKAFQAYVLSLTKRGVLLTACSKNDFDVAIQPFRSHPEMILREEHFVAFKANWESKAQNLIETANELNLGLDSFIFVDDNPAEVENVRQFAPAVTSILLGPDPSGYVRQLQESRLFERVQITGEDLRRTEQYREEANRTHLLNASVDMDSYLRSLEMVGSFRDFNPIDLPRIAQLINKSNQFNLTTIRRREAELEALVSDSGYTGFSMRLTDRFGDHGLISVIICKANGGQCLEVDTWLMSCRVLKRQVEEQVLNEIVRRAKELGYERVRGKYVPTAKNGMVRELYPQLGFRVLSSSTDCDEFELAVENFTPRRTFISIN